MDKRYRLPVFTDEILSQIIWGMENQDKVYLLNVRDGSVYCESESDVKIPSEYLTELPPWGSSDGYQLMVSYAIACKDQSLKSKLEAELSSKARGVFRRFRDVLATAGALDSWFEFKDRKMKSLIRSWYREKYGSEKQSDSDDSFIEFSEILADYEIRMIDCLDQYCLGLVADAEAKGPVWKRMLSAFSNKKAFIVVRDNLTCGAIIYEVVGDEVCILIYKVEPEHREAGLFRLLFDMFNREMERHQINKVVMPLTSDTSFIRTMLSDNGVQSTDLVGALSFSSREWGDNVDSAESAYLL